ncbi:cubilin-like [Glandiceps talaboti]
MRRKRTTSASDVAVALVTVLIACATEYKIDILRYGSGLVVGENEVGEISGEQGDTTGIDPPPNPDEPIDIDGNEAWFHFESDHDYEYQGFHITYTASYNCPVGWDESDEECYYYYDEELTWLEARLQCHLLHNASDLVVIKKESENVWLRDKYIDTNHWWIGGIGRDCGLMDEEGKYSDELCDEKHTFVCHILPKAYRSEDMVPQDLNAQGTATDKIYVNWLNSYYNCEVFGYYVKYKASGTFGDFEVVDVPGAESNDVTLTGLEATTWYDIYVTAYTSDEAPIETLEDVGPATAQTYESNKPIVPIPPSDKPCGSNLTAKNNSLLRILSPNYPSNYDNFEYCEWFVTATSEDKVITVYIRDFRTENRFDVLEIGEGLDSYDLVTRIHELSGSGSPWHYWTSSSHEIWLRFTSDFIFTRRGFYLEISESTIDIPTPRPEPEVPPQLTDCGGNLTVFDDPEYIYSPNYPDNYENDLFCIWKVAAQSGARLLITFLDFETEQCHDWLEIGNGLDHADLTTSQLRVSGSDYPNDHESIGEHVWLTFATDYSVTKRGFQLQIEALTDDLECGGDLVIDDVEGASVEIFSPNYEDGLNYNDNDLCIWTVTSASGDHVVMVINDFQTEAYYDWLEVGSGVDPLDTDSRLYRLSGSEIEGSFSTDSDNLWVVWTSDSSVTDTGFHVTFVIDEGCGGSVSGNPGNLSSPAFPNKYAHGSDCLWNIDVPGASRIRIYFHVFDLEDDYDFLYIGEGTEETSGSHKFELTGSELPKDIILNGNQAWVQFTSDDSVSGDGFFFTFEEYTEEYLPGKECGQTELELKTGSRLYIQSPNYPSNYFSNSWCVWTVTSESGLPMRIDFRDFWTERGFDWLDIGDGSDEADLTTRQTRLSGRNTPPPVYSEGDNLWITFSSDDTVNFRGFLLHITESDIETGEPKPEPGVTPTPPPPCGQHITVPDTGTVNVTSPNYPNDYYNYLDCEWTVNSTTGRRIEVIFIDFETEKMRDYLELGDGDDISDKTTRFMIVSGDDLPSPFTSHLSQLWLRFVTDGSETKRGFHIEFKEHEPCSGEEMVTIPTNPGFIDVTSPGFPRSYEHNLFCQWLISSESGGSVRVSIEVFETEQFYDWVDIGTGLDSTHLPSRLQHMSGSLVGFSDQYIFTTDSNDVWMTFSTDNDNKDDFPYLGFQIRFYDDGCVTEHIVETEGEIESPSYPSSQHYPHNADCVWIFEYKPGYEIHLTIDSFQLEQGYDKLLIGSGTDPNSQDYIELTGTISSGETRILYTHEAWLRFKSDWSISDSGFVIEYSIQCPSGYEPGHNDRCYKFVTDPLPWEEARDDCKETSDGDLVIIDDESEMNYLIGEIGNNKYWIGYSDRAVEGDWRWIDCSIPSEWHLSLWAVGEPSNVTGEDCGSSEDSEFYDELCSTRLRYVCEIHPHNMTYDEQNVQSVDAAPKSVSEINVWWEVAPVLCDVLGYKVKYHRTDYRGGVWVIDIPGGDSNAVTLSNLESATWYMMYVAAYTERTVLDYVPGYPVQTYEVIKPPYPIPDPVKECGGEYMAKNGSLLRIISPNYPDRYDNREHCEWFISATPGKVIAVYLRDFSTEPWFDYLDIGEGTDNSDGSTRVHHLSGFFKPWEYWTSETNELWFTFISDGILRLRGFLIELEEIDVELPEPKPLPTEPIEETPCGGNITVPSVGSEEIKSPNYPEHYDNDLECIWHVVSESGRRIKVTFEDFETETCHDWLVLGNGLDHTDLTTSDLSLSGSLSPDPYESHGDRMWLTFTTDYSVTRRGFNLVLTEIDDSEKTCGGELVITSDNEYVQIESPNYPDEYDYSDICIWTIAIDESLSDKDILMVVDDFDSEEGYDWLEVGLGDDHLDTSTLLYRLSGSSVEGSFATGSQDLWVLWTTDNSVNKNGYSIRFIAVDPCGGSLYGPTGNITSPGYPINYPHGSQCEWIITVDEGTGILISFSVFETEENYDYLYVGEGLVSDMSSGSELSGPELPKDIIVNSHQAWLVFTSDQSISYHGFHLTYEQYEEEIPEPKQCGAWYMLKVGEVVVIESPNYPQDYPNNVHCQWNVTTESGLPMIVQFRDFVTELGFDWLEIGNGLDSGDVDSSVRRISGPLYVLPLPVMSSHENIWLTFDTDDTITRRGFQLWIFEHNETEPIPPKTTPTQPATVPTPVTFTTAIPCGGHINVPNTDYVEFTSPNYPSNYDNKLNCEWTVSAEQGKRIVVTYQDFRTERIRDVLTVGTGSDPDSGTLMRRDSGTVLPSEILASTNEIWFEFVTDQSITYRGFEIRLQVYTTEDCGGELQIPTDDVETVIHPEGDEQYGNNELCDWILDADANRNVRVHVKTVDTEWYHDVIEIGEGRDSTARSTRLLTISGSRQDYTFYTMASAVWMTFMSDSSHVGDGFEIDFYDDACVSQHLTTFPGEVLSPNYPGIYPHNSDCTWQLEQLEGRQIRMTFNDLSLENGRDYLYIGDGNDPSSSPTLTLTGHEIPDIFISTSNMVWIRFESDWTVADSGFNITYDAECPVGYESGPLERCYRFVDEPLPWEEARDKCMETLHGDLVIVETQSEYAYILNRMNMTGFWIGLSDRAVEEEWKWVDCTDPAEWHEDLADGSNTPDKDCVVVTNGTTWSSRLCQDALPYICELNTKNFTLEDQNVNSVDAEALSSSSIHVDWELSSLRCDILGYRLRYHRTDMVGGIFIIDIPSADSSEYTLYGLQSSTWYSTYVAGYTDKIRLDYVPADPVQTFEVRKPPSPPPEPMKDCGGNYTAKSDSLLVITSPNYPDNYENNRVIEVRNKSQDKCIIT